MSTNKLCPAKSSRKLKMRIHRFRSWSNFPPHELNMILACLLGSSVWMTKQFGFLSPNRTWVFEQGEEGGEPKQVFVPLWAMLVLEDVAARHFKPTRIPPLLPFSPMGPQQTMLSPPNLKAHLSSAQSDLCSREPKQKLNGNKKQESQTKQNSTVLCPRKTN